MADISREDVSKAGVQCEFAIESLKVQLYG